MKKQIQRAAQNLRRQQTVAGNVEAALGDDKRSDMIGDHVCVYCRVKGHGGPPQWVRLSADSWAHRGCVKRKLADGKEEAERRLGRA